jgi:hypothetical protein
MNPLPNKAVLDELIEPIALCLTPDVAQRISALRASPELQQKLDDLADKNGAGELSHEELELYESYVRGLNFIGVLQARARALLKSAG